MAKRRVHVLTPSLEPHDAIGADVLAMAAALGEAGYDVRVFAERLHREVAKLASPLQAAPRNIWKSADAVLIYHHSMGWPAGEEILASTRNRRLIRYHNITPPRFFGWFSEPHRDACVAGMAATERIARTGNAVFLGDSQFNCGELIQLGAPPARCLALPPLHSIETLAATPFDPATLRQFKDGHVNILFVGGIKPNKGHDKALRAFAAYRRWANPNCRLIFGGPIDPRLSGYMDYLNECIDRLSLVDRVVFTGAVTQAGLRSLYTSANLFLSTSEHEGFGVPLAEAMFFRVPILAWGVTAVPETVGDAGLLWEEYNEDLFAESMDACIEHPELTRHLTEKGMARFQTHFRSDLLKHRLVEIVERAMEERPPASN